MRVIDRIAFVMAIAMTGRGVAQVQASPEALYNDAHISTSTGDLQRAIRDYEAILKLDPQLTAAYNNLGSLLLDTQQYERAIPVLRRCLILQPHLASASAMLGMAYLALGQPAEASKSLADSLHSDPTDKHVEDLLEQALVAQGDYKAATVRLQARVAQNPNDQDAYYRLGRVYLAMSQASLAKARTLNPNSTLAHILEGEIQESSGDLPGAEKQYTVAVQLEPTRPGVHEHLGNIHWLQGAWPAARSEFAEELKNDPASCTSRWKLANSLLQENADLSEALTELNHAVQRCPTLMQAHADRGKALVQLGRPAEAIADLQQAKQADPDEPSIRFWLAKAYKGAGQNASAETELEAFANLQKLHAAPPASSITHDVK